MNTVVRSVLIEVARKQKIIHYQELCDACKLKLDMYNNPNDRTEIGRILGEISEYEFDKERPLLSAIVLTKNGEEGDGFFKLCEYLGITNSWKKLKNDDLFVIEEIKRCHEFWADNGNYSKYK